MSKNLKTLICCILALIFVAGTVVAVFADSVAPAKETETATDVEAPSEEVSEDESTTEAPVKLRLGDVNFDGKITAADARLALRFAAKVQVPTAEEAIVADVITNGIITANDARLILRVSARLQPETDFGKTVDEPASDEAA